MLSANLILKKDLKNFIHKFCYFKNYCIFAVQFSDNAGVVELVDTLDLGSSAARCGSSSLPARTKLKGSFRKIAAFFVFNDFQSIVFTFQRLFYKVSNEPKSISFVYLL